MSIGAAAGPRFSVVIAAYNSARWIATTLRSVLAQTYRDYEILVIGDGCTDGTADILRDGFAGAVAWTNLEHNSGGQSFPNNEGIRRAAGTHVAYLGHDDIWAPTHLARMAAAVVAHDPDFVVSGAICHGPPGSKYYHITGLFEDPAAAATDFFPPSSFAHRREVAGRIGGWRHPSLTSAPADCDFLLRAVEARCSFASTQAVTVHKFAAGHRYLSYRFPSDREQSSMLARLVAPNGEDDVLQQVRDDIAQGADNLPLRYYDFQAYGHGEIYRGLRRAKGLDVPAMREVTGSAWLPVTAEAAALDWHELETHPLLGAFRWSGPNPAPRHLVNARMRAPARISIHVLAFAHPALMEALRVRIDERDVGFEVSRDAVGGYALKVAEPIAPASEGFVITFAMPFAVCRDGDARKRRVGLALRGVSLEPVAGAEPARYQT